MGNSGENLKTDSSMDRHTPVDQVAGWIDNIKRQPQGRAHLLTPLLSEQHPVYRDRSTGETARMRGYAMAALELTGTPQRAIPYILESLESEFHPYLVAAAARSLRGLERPHPQIAPFLIKAIYNIWENDNPINFDSYRVNWPQKEYTTALSEIFKTLAHFGSYAKKMLPELQHLLQYYADKFSVAAQDSLVKSIDAIQQDDREVDSGCCQVPFEFEQGEEPDEHVRLSDIPGNLVIEDQDGNTLEWKQFFSQKPTVVAFFYTRCSNPRKCTQTIFNLAALKRKLKQAGLGGKVRVAAITYDPKFDTAEALRSYGNARKFEFDDDAKMLRVPKEFDQVVQAFQLGVNFTGTQVNSHRIEIFLLDENGEIVRSFLRTQSDPEQVVDSVRRLLSDSSASVSPDDINSQKPQRENKTKDRFQAASSILLGCLMAFFPKCPMCWVSYMSLLGIAGAESIPYSPWLLPLIVVMLSINLIFLFRGAASRNGYLPFALSLFGSALLIFSVPQIGARWTVLPGLGLLLTGSLLQSLSYSKFNRLKLICQELQFWILNNLRTFTNVTRLFEPEKKLYRKD